MANDSPFEAIRRSAMMVLSTGQHATWQQRIEAERQAKLQPPLFPSQASDADE